jgi:N-acyl homoserine lactone hydrolase
MWALQGPTLTLPVGRIMVGGEGTVTIPVPCYLVQHERGLVLFDTGLDPEAQGDPAAVYGSLAHAVGMDYPADRLLEHQLGLVGFRLGDVTHVVVSHPHTDHVGGAYLFPKARMYAGLADLRYAFWPDAIDAHTYRRLDLERLRDFDWHPVWSDLDLFGDGAVTLLHLPGHTPGNLSLLVRLPTRTFVLTGDTVHLRAALDQVRPGPTDWSSLDARRSIERLRALRDGLDARIWISHDPDDAAELAFAPAEYS